MFRLSQAVSRITDWFEGGNEHVLKYFSLLGCLNGGAQLKAQDGQTQKELLGAVQKIYNEIKASFPEQNSQVTSLYECISADSKSGKSLKVLQTQFHEIKKNVVPLNIKW